MTGARVPRNAERAWYLADIKNIEAERAKFEVEAETLREELVERKYERRNREAWALSRRTYDFVDEVDEDTIKEAVDVLSTWASVSKSPITLRLCSPGGDVFNGLMLYDLVHDLRRDGVVVNTVAMGYAASMAATLFQAGERRTITRQSWYMIHEPSSIALGKASDIKDEAVLLGKLHKQLIGIAAERSTLSVKQILARCNRKNWWMSAADALKYGFADEIV